MMRATTFVATFVAIFAVSTAVPSWLKFQSTLSTTTVRQIQPTDLVTTFTRNFADVRDDCPNTIAHTGANPLDSGVVEVAPGQIRQENTVCTGENPMRISSDRGQLGSFNQILSQNPSASAALASLDQTGVDLLYGIQVTPRQCGRTRLRGGTILVFFANTEPLSPGAFLPFRANFNHMVIYRPGDQFPCVYNAARQAAPETTTPPANTTAPGGGGGVVVPGGGGGAQQTDGPEDTGGPVPSGTPEVDGGAGGGTPPIPGAGASPSAGAGGAEVTPETTDDGTGAFGGDGVGDASPSPTDDGSVCFPGSVEVELVDGSVKKMEDVALNDVVRVDGEDHSEVFMFTHKMKDEMYAFVKASTGMGSLTATKGHYVYVNGRLTAMENIKVGDYLTAKDGAKAVVEKVQTVIAKGLFNPQTLHGDIYVNGFKASTYTTAVKPSFAHAILAPFRALHRVGANPLANAFAKGSDFLARFAPRGAAVY